MLGYKIPWHNRHGAESRCNHWHVDKRSTCTCACACVLPRGRKNSLVPVPRPCVSSRMEERHSSLVHSTITFTFYPYRGNTYVRTYVCSASTGFDAFQRTHLLFRLLLADMERELDAIASAASLERSFARGVDLPVSSSSDAFYDVHRYPERAAAMASGNARYVSRNLQSISICEDDKALIAKR